MAKKKASRGGTAMIRYVSKRELPSVRGNKRRVIDEVLAAEIEEHGDIDVNRLVGKIADESHPLHAELVWDDALCGQRYRCLQVYSWIQASRYAGYVSDHRKQVPKEAIAHEVKRAKLREYLPNYNGNFIRRPDALADDATRQQFIERRIEVLRSWARSVIDVRELQDIRSAIVELVGE
jgi:hypothetical protein